MSKSTKSGYLTVNVETYGGGLWHTWFDRDLSVAGRVLVKEGDRLQHRLVSACLHFANRKHTSQPSAKASAAIWKPVATRGLGPQEFDRLETSAGLPEAYSLVGRDQNFTRAATMQLSSCPEGACDRVCCSVIGLGSCEASR